MCAVGFGRDLVVQSRAHLSCSSELSPIHAPPKSGLFVPVQAQAVIRLNKYTQKYLHAPTRITAVIRRFAPSISSVRWASSTRSRLISAFLLARKESRCELPWVEGMVFKPKKKMAACMWTQSVPMTKKKSTCLQTFDFFAQLGCLLILSTPVCFETRRFIRESSGISRQGGCERGVRRMASPCL